MFHYLISSDVIKEGKWQTIYGFLSPNCDLDPKSADEIKACDAELEAGIRHIRRSAYYENYSEEKRALIARCRAFMKEAPFRFLDVQDIELAVQFYAFYQTIPDAEKKLREEMVVSAVDHFVREPLLRVELTKHVKTWLFLLPKSSIAEYVSSAVLDLFNWAMAEQNDGHDREAACERFEELYGKEALAPAAKEFEERQTVIKRQLTKLGYRENPEDANMAANYLLMVTSVKGWQRPPPAYFKIWGELSLARDKILSLVKYVNDISRQRQDQPLHVLFHIADSAMGHLVKADEAQWGMIWTIAHKLYLSTEVENSQNRLLNTTFYLRLQLFAGDDIGQICGHLLAFGQANPVEWTRLSEKLVRWLETDEKKGGFESGLVDAAVLHYEQRKKKEEAEKEEERARQKAVAELSGGGSRSKPSATPSKKRRRKTGKRKYQPTRQEQKPKKKTEDLLDLLNTKLAIPTLEDDIRYRVGELEAVCGRFDKVILSLKDQNELKEAKDHLAIAIKRHQTLAGMLNILHITPDRFDTTASRQAVLAADGEIREARAFLHNLVKSKASVSAFQKDLMEKLSQETLDTARKDGGRITPHHLDFESIEALYHGYHYSTTQEVTIDGLKRALKETEALVLYVTKSSNTKNVLFCISVGLWLKRLPTDPRPSFNDRRSYIGDPTKNIKINPEEWIYTGKTLLTLHVETSGPAPGEH